VSASRGRRRRQRTAAAAKAKRQKIFAIIGAVLFAIVLFIQVPRILNRDGGSSATATETTAAPAPTPVATTTTKSATSKQLKSLIANRPEDPFGTRAIGDGEPPPGTATGGRDPFVGAGAEAQPTPTRLPARIVIGTPRAGKTGTVGYIVVLASVPTRQGPRSADRIAARARNRGIDGVAVLQSSTRKSLRAGYYVVYVGSYKTQGAALGVAARLHSRGFGDAYIRELVRF